MSYNILPSSVIETLVWSRTSRRALLSRVSWLIYCRCAYISLSFCSILPMTSCVSSSVALLFWSITSIAACSCLIYPSMSFSCPLSRYATWFSCWILPSNCLFCIICSEVEPRKFASYECSSPSRLFNLMYSCFYFIYCCSSSTLRLSKPSCWCIKSSVYIATWSFISPRSFLKFVSFCVCENIRNFKHLI